MTPGLKGSLAGSIPDSLAGGQRWRKEDVPTVRRTGEFSLFLESVFDGSKKLMGWSRPTYLDKRTGCPLHLPLWSH